MNELRLAIVAAALAVGSCASDDGGVGTMKQPDSSSNQGQTIDVEIIVGKKPDLDAQCTSNVSPTTIFVASQKEVYHCIGSKLHDHSEHGKTPEMEKSIVRVSANDRVRWFSKTHMFSVTSVVKQAAALAPQDKAAPDQPFGNAFAAKPALEVVTTPLPDLPGKVEQRYKVAFNIQGIGPVDPDLICSF